MAEGVNLGSVYASLELRTEDWERQINEAQNKISNAEKKVNGSLASMGKGFTSAGTALSVGLTAPLVLFAKTSADTALDVEVRWKEVEKVYGSTAGAFQRDSKMLTDAVDSVSVKFGYAKEDVLGVLAEISALGYEGPKSINMVTQALEFARTGNLTLERSLESVVAVSKIYNVEGDKLRATLSKLNTVENMSAASMGDLGEAITITGSAALSAGVDIDELSGFIAVMRERGIAAGEAANGLKTIFTRLRSTAVGDLEAIGIAVDLGNGKLKESDQIILEVAKQWNTLSDAQKEEIAQSAAGVYQKDKFLGLMAALNTEGNTYGNILKELSNEEQNLAKYTNEINVFLSTKRTRIAQASVAMKNFKTIVGTAVLDAFVPFAEALSKMATAFVKLEPGMQKAIIYFGAFLAAIGPVLIIIGQMASGIAVLGKVATFLKLGAAIGSIGTAFSAAIPAVVGFVIAFWPLILIAALVAGAAYLIWKNWEKIGPIFEQVKTAVVDFVTNAITWFQGLPDRIGSALSSMGVAISTAFSTAWTAVSTFFSVTAPTALMNFVTQTIPNFIVSLIGALVSGLAFIVGVLIYGVPMLIEAIMIFFWELPGKIAEALVGAYEAVSTWGSNTYNYLLTNVPIWWNNFLMWMANMVVKAGVQLMDLYNRFVNWGKGVWAWMSTEVPRQFNEFISWITALPGRAQQGLSTLASNIMGEIMKAWKSVTNEVSQWPSRMMEWGAKIARAFVDGFGKLGEWLGAKIQEGLKAAEKFVKGESPPPAGPFKNIDKWGANVGMAWVEGFATPFSGLGNMLDIGSGALAIRGEVSPVSSTTTTVDKSVTNAPVIHLNIGMYAGTEIEKREIAVELNRALENYKLGTGEGINE